MQNLKFGGAEQVLITFLKNFNRNKYQVELVLHTKEGALVSAVPADVTLVSLVPADDKTLHNKIARTIFFRILKYAPIILRCYFKFLWSKADLVVSFMEGIATSIASEFPGPKIAWVHTDVTNNPWADQFFKNERMQIRTYERYNEIIFVSTGGLQSFDKKFTTLSSIKKRVIHNPIDVENIQERAKLYTEEVRSWIKQTQHAIRLITVGRLDPVKRVDILINAVYQIRNLDNPIILTIIGSGKEELKLKKLIKKSNKRVLLLGAKSNPMPYVKNCDLFVSTSAVESFPTAIIESLALGVPVLATKNAGSKEVLENNPSGRLLTNNISASDLSEQIYKAIKNFNNLTSKKTKHTESLFDIQVILAQYDAAFEEVIKAHGQ